MRTDTEWLTAVRGVGLASYLTVIASCALGWFRNRRDAAISRLIILLGILNTGLFLDMAFDWRWRLHDLLQEEAIADHWYAHRTLPQAGTLALLGIFLAIGIGMTRRKISSPGMAMAMIGTLVSISCWSTEVISLHAMDMVLYRRAGALMIVDFVWMTSCAMTAIGILRAPR
jgi:hypothetical protein